NARKSTVANASLDVSHGGVPYWAGPDGFDRQPQRPHPAAPSSRQYSKPDARRAAPDARNAAPATGDLARIDPSQPRATGPSRGRARTVAGGPRTYLGYVQGDARQARAGACFAHERAGQLRGRQPRESARGRFLAQRLCRPLRTAAGPLEYDV